MSHVDFLVLHLARIPSAIIISGFYFKVAILPLNFYKEVNGENQTEDYYEM